MMNQKNNATPNLLYIGFAEAMQPVFKESKSKEWVTYGEEDNYPDYLLDLFNNSPKHSAIVKGKVNYIVGNGFEIESDTEQEQEDFVNDKGDTLNMVLRKCALDLELYGGFYLEVIQKVNEDKVLSHIPYHKMRSSKDNKKFFYMPDGNFKTGKKTDVVPLEAYDPNQNQEKSVVYYKEYRAGIDVYTLPDYIGALNYIESDKEVSKHTLNNAKSGFTPSKVISFFNGEPSEDEKKEIERRWKKKFTGSDAFKFILSFGVDPNKKLLVDDLGQSDLTKEDFNAVNLLIQQEIFAGHQITSPILFGIKTEGQLGGRTEMRDAYEIFKNTYVNAKQKMLEEVFEALTGLELNIKPVEPLSVSLTESVISQNLTQEEVRSIMGYSPLVVEQKEQAQKIAESINTLSPLVANKVLDSMTEDEIRSLAGLPPKGNTQTPEQAFEEEQQLFEVFNEYGESKDDYCVISSKHLHDASKESVLMSELEMYESNFITDLSNVEAKILALIKKDKYITPNVIADALNVNVSVVDNYIKSFVERGMIKTKIARRGEDDVTEIEIAKPVSKEVTKEKPSTLNLQIKYSYEGPKDSRNRPFCKALLSANKLYTRAEIEQISIRLGYSVWDRRGGWYRQKGTDVSRPYCRHTWATNIVTKKK